MKPLCKYFSLFRHIRNVETRLIDAADSLDTAKVRDLYRMCRKMIVETSFRRFSFAQFDRVVVFSKCVFLFHFPCL